MRCAAAPSDKAWSLGRNWAHFEAWRFFEVTRGRVIIAGPRTIASIPAFANEDQS